MARRPDVSIIIPTLDEEKYIEDALNALTSQKTPLSYEIILGDGHSKDRTVKIGERYGARAVYEPKRTISAGRQKGAEAALGRIIVHSGADVHMDPHWLDRLVEPILGGTHVASMGPVLPRDGNWAERLFSAGVLKPLGHGLSHLGFHFVVADNMAVRSDIFHKAGGFNTDLVTAEDTDLIKRVAPHGKVAYVPDAHIYVSMRRVRDWGYAKYLHFHTSNFLKFHFSGEGHGEYEPVR